MSTVVHDNFDSDREHQTLQGLDPLTDDEAVREVGWVARRARELVERSDDAWADWAEFFDRRARLLEHIGQPALASDAKAKADHARRAWSGAQNPKPLADQEHHSTVRPAASRH